MNAPRPPSPKVFISYSHDSPEHEARVRALADRMRADGVDVDLDQYEVAPTEGWPQWTRRAIERADAVLTVFTETYRRRYLGEEAAGTGLGVAWEGRILTQALYNDAGHTLKLIPVVFEAEDARYIPLELQGATRHELATEAGYEDLYRRLTDQYRRLTDQPWEPSKPPLGRILRLQPEDRAARSEARETQASLTETLERAYEHKARLEDEGEDTTEVIAEILDLKRRLREGGQLKAGDILAHRFKLLEPLGRGGFSTVWKAFDRGSRQHVAVKVLHSQYAEDRSRRERFFRGARKMHALHHPGIVRVLERELEDQGFHFFVMEYVRGGDLRQAVLEKKLVFAERLEIILAVGTALTHAHENGLVHRDVKPANILLDQENRPKLTDFDLVRAADSTGGTRTHGMLGTFLYAAPEAMDQAKKAGVLADVYSLGMTAVFTLAAQGDLPHMVLRDAAGYIAGIDCHEGLKTVLTRAVAWETKERHASVATFCNALRKAAVPPRPSKKVRKAAVPPRGELVKPFVGEHAPGTEWVHEKTGMVFVHVPGGEYPQGEGKLSHRVSLSPFWIGKYPVTNEQYARFLEAMPHQEKPEYWNDPRFNPGDHPVVGVSWKEAKAFCAWAGLALPSEAQWVAAARGRKSRRYPWGDEKPTAEHANFGQPSNTGQTTPVTAHPAGAGPYGTMGQAGNVWEWCEEVWDDEAYSRRQGIDPVSTKGTTGGRVVRGGSWLSPSRNLVAAYRFSYRIVDRSRYLGFRCVGSVPPEP